MTDGGQVTTWINQRGFSSGNIAPSWMPGIVTHGGPGTAGTRAKITFGRVYTPSTGNSDYIQASSTGIQIYENQGTGGRTVAGDGVYYCEQVTPMITDSKLIYSSVLSKSKLSATVLISCFPGLTSLPYHC